jgi:hypothetical protein
MKDGLLAAGPELAHISGCPGSMLGPDFAFPFVSIALAMQHLPIFQEQCCTTCGCRSWPPLRSSRKRNSGFRLSRRVPFDVNCIE